MCLKQQNQAPPSLHPQPKNTKIQKVQQGWRGDGPAGPACLQHSHELAASQGVSSQSCPSGMGKEREQGMQWQQSVNLDQSFFPINLCPLVAQNTWHSNDQQQNETQNLEFSRARFQQLKCSSLVRFRTYFSS